MRLSLCLSAALLAGCGLTLDLQPPDDASFDGFDAGRRDAGPGVEDGGPPPPECTGPADCDDGDVCNGVEICDLSTGSCVTEAPPSCDDGDACTVDGCEAGACVSHPIDCDDGVECTEARCDPDTGECVQVPRDDLCPPSATTCLSSECDPESGCVNVDLCVPAGGECDPASNACEYPDCEAACVPLGPCVREAYCSGNTCVQGLHPAGTPCDSDMCRSGVCSTSGTCVFAYRTCDDGDSCTIDSCDATTGCVFTPRPDGRTCDTDGDLCTIESCHAGACTTDSTVACADTDMNPCTGAECDPATGTCRFPPLPGAACDDGNPCGLDEVCQTDGSCLATRILMCAPTGSNVCSVSTCDEAAEMCVMIPAPAGTACGTNAFCTSGRCECAAGYDDCDGDNHCECDRRTGFCGLGVPGGTSSGCRPYLACDAACASDLCCPCTGTCRSSALERCVDGLGNDCSPVGSP